MAKIRLAIVGCGGMGHRHMYGLAELYRAGLSPFELVAACDPVTANAESLADQATGYFGSTPAVVANLEELAALGVEAVDITTTPRFHHTVAIDALEKGWHMMIEKPVGLTVRACNLIWQAAKSSGKIVSVSENYRRDPINRLARALLDAGAIGTPRLLMHHTLGGQNKMLISVWRHQKDQSGVLLDVGVHFSDMMEYLLGEIEVIYGQTRLHESIRHNPAASGQPASNPAGVYGRWQKQMPAEFEATAEDAAYATLTFRSGAVGQYIEDHAAHGQGLWQRRIYGAKGALELPHDRSGERITLYLNDQEPISDGRLLDFVPDFQLDPVTAALFDGTRLWEYGFPFAETDRKLIAVEYADFGQAVAGKQPVEVDIEQGTRSVAISYAFLESSLLGRAVTVQEVMSELVAGYQQEINDGLGI